MIVRHLQEIVGTEREVGARGWSSRRLLLRKDGMGFSMHDTVIEAGAELPMWYRHHLEAVYCVEGEGSIQDEADGRVYRITPGTIYALDQHDKHILRAETQLRLVCVFNPPLSGEEVHDETGAYPLVEDDEGDRPATKA